MNKYVKLFEEKISESSMGRGSIILIKGKPEKGKRKLFATHIIGFAEVKPGAVMLFLSDDFYRIKEEDGKLRAVKISYRSEDSLKSVLNLKTPGKISVVRNNNKTPLHWKTLKHTNISSALRDVEGDLLGDDYLFESEGPEYQRINEFYNDVAKAFFRALDGVKNEIVIVEYSSDSDITQKIEDNIDFNETDHGSTEWEASFQLLPLSQEFEKYATLSNVNLNEEIWLDFMFSTEASFNYSYDPGDFWTPPSGDSEVREISTSIEGIFVNGDEVALDEELAPILSNFQKKIEDDWDLKNRMNAIKKNHLF